MTRACQCRRHLGEKCSRCGSSDLNVFEARNGIFFMCMCGFGFRPGEGGITTGLCEDCEKREIAKLKELRGANAG